MLRLIDPQPAETQFPRWEGTPEEVILDVTPVFPEKRTIKGNYCGACGRGKRDRTHTEHPTPPGYHYLGCGDSHHRDGEWISAAVKVAPVVEEYARARCYFGHSPNERLEFKLIRRRRSIALYAQSSVSLSGICLVEWAMPEKPKPGEAMLVELSEHLGETYHRRVSHHYTAEGVA